MEFMPVKAKPSGPEHRRNPRYRVLLNADIVTTSDEQSAKVRDLSTGGAMLHVRHAVAEGEDVILRRGSIELFAKVCWTSGSECGIQFDGKLTEAEMIAFVQEPAKQPSFVSNPFRMSTSFETDAPLRGLAYVAAGEGPIGRGLFGR